MTRIFGVLSLLILLGGCTTPTVRFHTLMPPPGQALENQPEAPAIQVEQVLVPAYVDRSELVVRRGDTELVVLSSDWWSATLAEEIRSALMARLALRAGEGDPVRMSVRLTRVDAVPGRGVWLNARFILSADQRNLACITRLHREAGEGIEALVSALQASVAELAGQIQAAAGPGPAAWSCPGR